MERVLKAVPEDLRVKMEALVHDLSLALEESSNSTNVKRRWGLRRRARSTGNIPSLSANKHSEDSSSSICDIRIPKTSSTTKYQSDSDDTDRRESFARFWNLNAISNVESDSVNEYFVPRINTKRKRKFKRMAVDSSNPSTSQAITQKKRLFRTNCENRYDCMSSLKLNPTK
uniref:ORF1_1 protein n=1 Tax=Fopius arisanus TaxID=64838 RepID=A0A0C9QPU7_9HYME